MRLVTYALVGAAVMQACAAAAIGEHLRMVVQEAGGLFTGLEIRPLSIVREGEGKNHTLNNIIRDVSEEDDILDIKYADIDPEQPKRSTPVHINALAYVKEPIDTATANIKVKWGFITLLNRNYDLCKELETNLNKTCPVEEGPIELSIDIDVPGFVPPGWFHLEATAWRDSDEKQLGRILADKQREVGLCCKLQSVLELGATGALPSLVSACNGASRVVITDYPDHDLVENIRRNVRANIPAEVAAKGLVAVAGFKWGYDIEKIAELSTQDGAFDVLILSDLVFNHSEHSALLRSVDRLMARPRAEDGSGGGEAYVFFTHHRPWLADKDMDFLARASSEFGLVVSRLVEDYAGAMFDTDPGDERVRGTVHGFRMTRPRPS